LGRIQGNGDFPLDWMISRSRSNSLIRYLNNSYLAGLWLMPVILATQKREQEHCGWKKNHKNGLAEWLKV
jgi:hypothetical protein